MQACHKRWCFVLGLMVLLSTSRATAQSWMEGVGGPEYPDLSAHADGGNGCSDCGLGGCLGGCTANEGVFFQWDRVYWSISAPNVTTIGDPTQEGMVTPPGGNPFFHNNDLDTSFLESEFKTGDRFDFGRIQGNSGWGMSVLHVRQHQALSATGVNFIPNDPDSLLFGYSDSNGDGFDDDLDLDNIFGRHGQDLGTPNGAGGFVAPFDGTPDTPAPTDRDDGVLYLVVFSNLNVRNETELTGVELMNIYRSPRSSSSGVLEWSYGVRYLKVKDRFNLFGTGGFLDTMQIDTVSDNDIVGPQIGVRYTRQCGYVRFALEGRFLAGFNHQRTDQSGIVASNQSSGGTNGPLFLIPNSFYHTLTEDRFAPLGELRADMVYKINRCVAFRFGYTALVTNGISRASERVVYTLPEFGINPLVADNEVLVNNALTFGLEFNR